MFPDSFLKRDPDPHAPKKLDPDPHKINADPKHCLPGSEFGRNPNPFYDRAVR
jgi:hypothetical protein